MSLARGVAVRLRPDGQRGLFALKPLLRHEILITYDGPLLDHPTRYSIQIDDNLHIEGTPESNAYLNHSCSPNTYVDWKGVFLRALRDIEAGEELTCNYLTTDWELHEKFICTCGAPNCYGELRGFKYLSAEQQRALAQFVPEFMKNRIREKPQADFKNCYEDSRRAEAYAHLDLGKTYYLAFRDLPTILRQHVTGTKALDFGCGAGRSTRFIRQLGFETVAVDIAPEMIAKAKEIDPTGDYRLAKDDDLSEFPPGAYDLVLSLFTFDNIPGLDTKVRLFRDLGALLNASGKIVSVVSSPEIYTHEWASFSTRDYPENRFARTGDTVRIVTTDFADSRPAVDILWTDESYQDVYVRAGLKAIATYRPIATGDEPYNWVNETKVAPWVIYVLARKD